MWDQVTHVFISRPGESLDPSHKPLTLVSMEELIAQWRLSLYIYGRAIEGSAFISIFQRYLFIAGEQKDSIVLDVLSGSVEVCSPSRPRVFHMTIAPSSLSPPMYPSLFPSPVHFPSFPCPLRTRMCQATSFLIPVSGLTKCNYHAFH